MMNFIVFVVGIGVVFFDCYWLFVVEVMVLIWWSIGIVGVEDCVFFLYYLIVFFIVFFLFLLIYYIWCSDVV